MNLYIYISYHLLNDNLNSYPKKFKDCGNKITLIFMPK